MTPIMESQLHDVEVVWFSHDGRNYVYKAVCYTCPWQGAKRDPGQQMAVAEAERHRKATGG